MDEKRKGKVRIKAFHIFILFIIALLVCCGWSVWSSYNGVKVNSWTIGSGELRSDIRIAVLSDLHDGEPVSTEEFAENLTAQQPDIILMAGDMLNGESADTDRVCSLISRLSKVASVYFSLGNHELEYMERKEGLEAEITGAGAVVLELSYVDITVNGTALRIGGMYDYAFALDGNNSCDKEKMNPEVWEYLEDFQNTDSYKIMLAHRPDSFSMGEASATWDVDLVVSGHDHGGQVVLPVLGGVFGGDQGLFPEYIHGVYEKDSITMAITSGLGSNNQKLPRFNNPPEIMVLNLISEG